MFPPPLPPSLLPFTLLQEEMAQEEATDSVQNKDLFNIYEMEIQRLRFLLRSYLRTRLSKLERHTAFYLQTERMRANLSVAELSFATRLGCCWYYYYSYYYYCYCLSVFCFVLDDAWSGVFPSTHRPIFNRPARFNRLREKHMRDSCLSQIPESFQTIHTKDSQENMS